MQHLKNHLNNELGMSLIPVMIILFMGTIIGIAATTTSQFEVKVAVNDRNYKQNFYRADATNQHASRNIEDTSDDDLKYRTPDWMTIYNQPANWYIDVANWITDPTDPNVNAAVGSIADPNNGSFNTKYMVVDHGAAPGAEISMGSPFMHALGVYGRYDHATRGRVIIETEYRKKY